MRKNQTITTWARARGLFLILLTTLLLFSGLFQAAPVFADTFGACPAGLSCIYLPTVGDEVAQDLVLQNVEVTQAVQDAQNGVPLVAGRPTVMRIYATAVGVANAVSGVTVSVEATRSGNQAVQSPNSFKALVPLKTDRADYSSTINFPLPESWLTGTLDIKVKLDSSSAVREKREDNNTFSLHLNFNKVPELNVMIVPVEYSNTVDGHTYTAPSEDTISDWLMRIYPVSKVSLTWHAPYAFSGDLRTTADFNRLLNEVTTLKSTEKAPTDQIYYGLVPTKDGAKSWFYGGIAGIGWVGNRAAVGLEAPGNTAQIAGHEIGHNLGMQHTPCGVSGDPNYPYAGGSIGQYGLDIFTNSVYTPSGSKDMMSYCNPRWISDYTYKFLFDSQVASASTKSAQMPVNGESNHAMLVRATIAGSQVTLQPSYIFNDQTSSMPTAGDYTIQVLGMQGDIIAQVAVPAYRIQEEEESESDTVYGINAIIPVPDQPAAGVRVVKNGQILAEQNLQVVTTKLPVNVVVEPTASGTNVRWGGTGAQPALLRYSADSGKTWMTLATDVQNGQMHLAASTLTTSDGIFDLVPANTWR